MRPPGFIRRALVPLSGLAGGILTKTLMLTVRHEARGLDRMEGGGPHILAFWHNRILGACSLFRHRGYTVMISRHADGEIIARIAARYGHSSVRGSSGRGGREALSEMASILEGGRNVAITPDGPRGPRYRLQPGVALLMRKTSRPVIPCAAAYSSRIKFSSWDRFELPYPFSRMVLHIGEPVLPVEGEGTRETMRRIEEALISVTRAADAEFGRETERPG